MSGNSQTIDAGSGQIQHKKVIRYGTRAKMALLSKIKRAKNRLKGSDNNNKTLKTESSSSGLCCWCIGRTPSKDLSSESPTSDPNASGFGFDSLKGLIEKSDFLLDDCNTHLDVYINDDEDVVVDEDDDYY